MAAQQVPAIHLQGLEKSYKTTVVRILSTLLRANGWRPESLPRLYDWRLPAAAA